MENDKLARQAPIDGILRLDRGDILKRVIDKFKEAENEDNNNNGYIQRMREMGVREGEGRQSVLKGKTKSVYNQLITCTVSVATLIFLLERRAEQLWVCTVCNEAEVPFCL